MQERLLAVAARQGKAPAVLRAQQRVHYSYSSKGLVVDDTRAVCRMGVLWYDSDVLLLLKCGCRG